MQKPRGNGLSAKICYLLLDTPRPLFLGEIEAALGFEFSASEIMSALVKLRKRGSVASEIKDRDGAGRKKSNAYYLCVSDFIGGNTHDGFK